MHIVRTAPDITHARSYKPFLINSNGSYVRSVNYFGTRILQFIFPETNAVRDRLHPAKTFMSIKIISIDNNDNASFYLCRQV